jgi:hypothetical protein
MCHYNRNNYLIASLEKQKQEYEEFQIKLDNKLKEILQSIVAKRAHIDMNDLITL